MSWVWHKERRRQAPVDWDQVIAHPQAGRLEALYAWERRCRGYELFTAPVALEPVFVPFVPGVIDSGGDIPLPRPAPAVSLSYLSLRLPPEQKVTPALAESWLRALRALSHPVAFEIIGDEREIVFQLACAHYDRGEATAATQMHFSAAQVEATPDVLHECLARCHGETQHGTPGYGVVDFGLMHLAYLPLQSLLAPGSAAFAADPQLNILGALSQLRAGEAAGVQVLLTAARSPWEESLLRVAGAFAEGEESAPAHGRRDRFPAGQALRLAQAKLSTPLLAVAIRIFAISAQNSESASHESAGHPSESHQRAFELCRRVGSALEMLAQPGGNALLALDDGGYPPVEHLGDLLERRSRRPGALISTAELSGLVHPPTERLLHPKLRRCGSEENRLPDHLLNAPGAVLGRMKGDRADQSRGEQTTPSPTIPWPDAFRPRHCYLLGATRMGKSTLLLNLIAQDMAAGRGLCLIDPHGDLARDVLALVPPERAADTYYLDLADREHPVSMGLLQAQGEWEKRLLSSDLLSILRRLFAASWGDRLEHILRHVLLTLIELPECTLRDIRPLLSNAAYREELLQGITDPGLLSFWHGEFAGYSASTFSPIYNKLGLLLSSPLVRNIIAQSRSRLDLARLMREKKILLVNLNAGLIGEDNAHFLGALLVSRLQIAAMQSLRHEQESRTPCTLYVDEFQHFVTSSFEKILSEAGKAGLSLVLANQFLEQLSDRLEAAILGNVGTLCCFRVSAESARRLEKELAGRFEAKQIVSLGRGEAIVRLGSAEHSALIATLPPPPQEHGSEQAERVRDEIMVRTRQEVCRPRAVVEAEIAAGAAREVAAREREEAKREEAKRDKSHISIGQKSRANQTRDEPRQDPKEVVVEAAGAKPDGDDQSPDEAQSVQKSPGTTAASRSRRSRRRRSAPATNHKNAATQQPMIDPASDEELDLEAGRAQTNEVPPSAITSPANEEEPLTEPLFFGLPVEVQAATEDGPVSEDNDDDAAPSSQSVGLPPTDLPPPQSDESNV